MSDEPETPAATSARWIAQLRSRAVGDSVWSEAVEGLRRIGFHAVPALIEAWADEDAAVRLGVRKALHQIGPIVLSDVIDALQHDQPAVRLEAASWLSGPANQRQRLIADIVPPLIEAFKDPESPVRLRAVQALSLTRENAQAAVPALVETLKDPEAYVREWAAVALEAIGVCADAAVPALTEALLDDDAGVRDAASQALDRIMSAKNRGDGEQGGNSR
jgi:HEAT repeat protein